MLYCADLAWGQSAARRDNKEITRNRKGDEGGEGGARNTFDCNMGTFRAAIISNHFYVTCTATLDLGGGASVDSSGDIGTRELLNCDPPLRLEHSLLLITRS